MLFAACEEIDSLTTPNDLAVRRLVRVYSFRVESHPRLSIDVAGETEKLRPRGHVSIGG